MMLENCCYDFFELLTLNMARQGMFGEMVHAEGAYIHDLTKDWLFNKNAYADMWRLKENYRAQWKSLSHTWPWPHCTMHEY